jgi:hypothetical protein
MSWWKRLLHPSPTGARPAATLELSLPGWTEASRTAESQVWCDSDGDVIRLTGHDFPIDFSDDVALRRWARELAQNQGCGLVEAGSRRLRTGPAGYWIFKRLDGPGYSFTGMLACARSREGAGSDRNMLWTVAAQERLGTGIREAVITAELMSNGAMSLETFQDKWACDPYDPAYCGVDRSVLRFLSDDESFDHRFPQHPLTKVRQVLRELQGRL